jgi:cytochrome bd-type quinol oxidase subunit 1
MILGIVVSTIVFFAATFLLRRKFDEMDIPKGMTRSLTIFALALAVAYGAGWLVDRF